ncbi:MAG TPA: TolC family protein [Thermoanaerobaculia bacterium]|jgi:HAE1 family hydrophobic/amphiphilic exporter-1
MTPVRRFVTTLLLSLTATSLFAQQATTTQASRNTEAVTAETDTDVKNARALQLSLSEAINLAATQNLGVQLQQYESRISGQNLRAQYGAFDWLTSATVDQSSSESPTTSTFASSGARQTRANASVSQLLPTGGQYTAGFTNSRTNQSGGGTFVNPSYRSGLQFSFAQPLMRDFGIDITRRGITIARNNLGITEESFRTALMNTVHSVEQAYLDLSYARRNIEVVKEALFLARDQARITQIRIDVGASAPLDILQPRVQIATTEEQLVSAVASVRDAEDRLRALLNLPRSEWDRPIVPTDNVTYDPMTVNYDAAVDQALRNRPEVTQQRLATDTLRVQSLYARNQTLPLVDFNLGYNLNGLAGRTIDLDPNTGQPTGRVNTTGYGSALTQLGSFDFPSWNVGFTFGVPVLNIGARANARAAELDYEQSLSFEQQTRQNISVEVRAAARAVETFARTIAASRAAREAAERNVEAERRRYENGMTTNFQVLEVQRQLSDARVRELFALVGYNKAVAAYHRAVGDILDVHNIRVQQPEHVDEPRMYSFLDRYNWLNYANRVDNKTPASEDQKK